MYIGNKFPLFGAIMWSKKYILIFLLIDVIPILLFKLMGWTWLAIPWQPIALIGIAVSFYLGFKNNSSYDRLWEARKIWGGIVNTSRTFAVMSRDFITNEFPTEKVSNDELRKIHLSIIHRHVAWLKALTYQMRMIKPWEHASKSEMALRKTAGTLFFESHFENIKPYISSSEYDYIMSKGNRASHLLSLQSKELAKLKLEGHIDSLRHMELEKKLGEFYTFQGKSERIKNFPFPRQYATINFIVVWIFLILLPFGMINVFSGVANSDLIWLAFPFSMLVSWVFILMEMIGDYSENPFEGLYNDVPISSMARSIEIDIRQMLDETDLPKPLEPVDKLNLMI